MRPGSGAALTAGCLALAAATLLLPSTPGYDPWAWLVWGRETLALDLDTTRGPAWKPLPVLVTAVLAPLGDAAPDVWLVLARASGLLALVAAWRFAARLADSRLAGAAAALGLALVPGFARGVALGSSEGLLVALVLLAAERHVGGRRAHALALGFAAALLRPEVWPFLALYGAWLARREPERRALAAALLAAVPALWLAPELWGSGDLLRSSDRARIPNPGAPALAPAPALEVVRRFAVLVAPVAAGALVALALALRDRRRAPLALAAAASAWVALVALMSEAGYSGEERYLLPAAALVAVLGGVGLAALATRGRLALAAALLLLAAPLPPAAPAARALASDLAYAATLRHDLAAAVARAGGGERLRACGRLYAGRYRFPLVAWHVRAHIAELSLAPTPPGVVLRSRLEPSRAPAPAVPRGFRLLAAAGSWEVYASC